MNLIKKICFMALMVATPMAAVAAGGSNVPLEKSPHDLQDNVSLQNGAKLFTTYCLSCHSADYMRYNRLRDIGMTDEEIEENIILSDDLKVGDTMPAGMTQEAGEQVFGVAPPDLSVISRSRSADWLYTYMISFHVDSSRPSGWNNAIFPNVGMPHVLAGMQGEQELVVKEDANGNEVKELVLKEPGSMTEEEYKKAMGDLTGFMVFMGEPAILVRYQLGYYVIGFLIILFLLTFALKREVWKDVH